MFKLLIIVNILLILASLAFSAFFLTKDDGDKNRVATALTVRISLSISLLVLIIIGYYLGYITPNALQ